MERGTSFACVIFESSNLRKDRYIYIYMESFELTFILHRLSTENIGPRPITTEPRLIPLNVAVYYFLLSTNSLTYYQPKIVHLVDLFTMLQTLDLVCLKLNLCLAFKLTHTKHRHTVGDVVPMSDKCPMQTRPGRIQ